MWRSARGSRGVATPPTAAIVAEVNEFFNNFALHKREHTLWVHSNAELLKKVSYHKCPSQLNGIDCGLFCVGVVLHLLDGINVDSTTFSHQDCSPLRLRLSTHFLHIIHHPDNKDVINQTTCQVVCDSFPLLQGTTIAISYGVEDITPMNLSDMSTTETTITTTKSTSKALPDMAARCLCPWWTDVEATVLWKVGQHDCSGRPHEKREANSGRCGEDRWVRWFRTWLHTEPFTVKVGSKSICRERTLNWSFRTLKHWRRQIQGWWLASLGISINAWETFMSFMALWMNPFPSVRPGVVLLDAGHLKGVHKGALYVASVKPTMCTQLGLWFQKGTRVEIRGRGGWRYWKRHVRSYHHKDSLMLVLQVLNSLGHILTINIHSYLCQIGTRVSSRLFRRCFQGIMQWAVQSKSKLTCARGKEKHVQQFLDRCQTPSLTCDVSDTRYGQQAARPRIAMAKSFSTRYLDYLLEQVRAHKPAAAYYITNIDDLWQSTDWTNPASLCNRDIQYKRTRQ